MCFPLFSTVCMLLPVCVCVCMCVRVCVCVRVHVGGWMCVREREREGDTDRQTERKRERERERECASVCKRVIHPCVFAFFLHFQRKVISVWGSKPPPPPTRATEAKAWVGDSARRLTST